MTESVRKTSRPATPPDDTDHWRPRFHFLDPGHWINDPNGLIVHAGTVHLFYQLNPDGIDWGHMSWGHATSTDFLNWTIRDVAIPETDDEASFSGSVVHDASNTSGLGQADITALVALFTGARHDNYVDQHQHLAYSHDAGTSWQRYASNPVLPSPEPDRRDPKVFWHSDSHCWIMLLAHADRHQVGIYRSRNLKTWEAASVFGPAGGCDGEWECPDLVALTDADSGEQRHVLIVSTAEGHPSGGSGVQYFVGHFDGHAFVSDADNTLVQWLDHGADFYAAQSFNDVPQSQRRTIVTAWMANRDYASDTPTTGWRGCHTVPRELRLHRLNSGWHVSQCPVSELTDAWQHAECRKNFRVEGCRAIMDLAHDGRCGEIELVLPRADSALSLRLFDGAHCGAVVTLDQRRATIQIRRANTGQSNCTHFERTMRARLPRGRHPITIRVVFDHSTLEVFVADGGPCLSSLVFAPPDATRIALASASGCDVTRLTLRSRFKPAASPTEDIE